MLRAPFRDHVLYVRVAVAAVVVAANEGREALGARGGFGKHSAVPLLLLLLMVDARPLLLPAAGHDEVCEVSPLLRQGGGGRHGSQAALGVVGEVHAAGGGGEE